MGKMEMVKLNKNLITHTTSTKTRKKKKIQSVIKDLGFKYYKNFEIGMISFDEFYNEVEKKSNKSLDLKNDKNYILR